MTASRESEPLTERESFWNSYYYFVEALKTLSLPAGEQCERLGYFNVAWELKHDVGVAKYLLQSTSSSCLSRVQRSAVENLLVVLSDVAVTQFRGERQANLDAMRHASWVPLRPLAEEVLRVLVPITLECRRFLRMDLEGDS